jgi:hypothetical protein
VLNIRYPGCPTLKITVCLDNADMSVGRNFAFSVYETVSFVAGIKVMSCT